MYVCVYVHMLYLYIGMYVDVSERNMHRVTYVCMYICICLYESTSNQSSKSCTVLQYPSRNVCIYAYVYMIIYAYVYAYVYMYMCMYADVGDGNMHRIFYVFMYICMSIHMNICTYVYTYVYMYICMYADVGAEIGAEVGDGHMYR